MALFFTLKELKTISDAYEDYGVKSSRALDKVNAVLNNIHFDKEEISEIVTTLETLPESLKQRGEESTGLTGDEISALQKAKMIQLIHGTPRKNNQAPLRVKRSTKR